jgi:hypothetical protein
MLLIFNLFFVLQGVFLTVEANLALPLLGDIFRYSASGIVRPSNFSALRFSKCVTNPIRFAQG